MFALIIKNDINFHNNITLSKYISIITINKIIFKIIQTYIKPKY